MIAVVLFAGFCIYVIAAVVSWRLYGILFLLPQILLALLWVQHRHAVAQPGHDGGPGEALGLMIVLCVQAGLILAGIVAGAAVAIARRVVGAEPLLPD